MPEVDQRILDAQARFKLADEAEREIRVEALDCLRFRKGDQWNPGVKALRLAENRPCITLNTLPAKEHQILNDQRQNRPAILVSPVDDNADPDTAEIIQGLVRHIEYDSNADVADDTALASAVRGGWGYVRIDLEYEDPKGFEQVIKIRRLRNPLSVYKDPFSTEPDGSDSDWYEVVCDYNKDEYKREYPNSELSSFDDWGGIGNTSPTWLGDDHVRVVEYFYREKKQETLLVIQDAKGQRTVLKSELEEGAKYKVIRKRETTITTVKWCKINAIEILEETEWPSQWIGIVPLYGDELYIDGKLYLEGMINHLKDPCKMANAMASSQLEAIALAPKAPWLAAAGQIEGFEDIWQTANTKTHGVLPYNALDVGGKQVPEPKRIIEEPAIQAITEALVQFKELEKDITGIHDAQLGIRSNEQSGVAIDARKVQGEVANFHFADNARRTKRHVGRIILDLIPKIYDTERVLRIIGEDGTQKTVRVNQNKNPNYQAPDPNAQNPEAAKVEKIYDLTVGKYDVTVSSGPSYNTKRQQSVASMLDLAKSYPPLVQIAGDLMVNRMDWPGHEEIAERLKRALPPGMADPEDGQEPIPPQAQQQLAQQGQMIEAMTAALKEAQQKIEGKQLELESGERIAMANNQTKERIADLQYQTQLLIAGDKHVNEAAIASLEQELAHLHKLMDQQTAERQMAQQADAQDQQLGHQADQAAQDREFQGQQSDADRQAAAEAQANQADSAPV